MAPKMVPMVKKTAIASDRISTYDAVHPNSVPGKGAVLTGVSAFWFDQTAHIVPNHVISYTDGVPVEARGRGLATRLLRRALADARARGQASTTLVATAKGAPVYERIGYRSVGRIEMWERREAPATV